MVDLDIDHYGPNYIVFSPDYHFQGGFNFNLVFPIIIFICWKMYTHNFLKNVLFYRSNNFSGKIPFKAFPGK